MLCLGSRSVPTSVDELLLEPNALVIWDMQPAIAGHALGLPEVVKNCRRLHDAASSRGTPTIYSQHRSLPLEAEDRAWIRSQWIRAGRPTNVQFGPRFDTVGQQGEILEELAPRPGDLVLPKTRASFFVGTPFRALLAARGIDVIILTGVATDRGILTTAREAASRGLFVVVVADATASFSTAGHARGIEMLSEVCDVSSTSEILRAWATSTSA